MIRVAVFVLLAVACSADKLPIQVFYESLCPDSIRFIQNQLKPSYKDLAGYIDLEFVPFGKSRSYENGTFWCQHGAPECRLNRVQSCALLRLESEADEVDYVSCQMVTGADRTGRVCVEGAGLSWIEVEFCHDSRHGHDLQIKLEQIQQKVLPGGYPSFVPTIVANGTYDSALQNGLYNNFKATVCSLLTDKPPTC